MMGGLRVLHQPYKFVPGGVYGLGIVLHNIFPSIQVGTFGYMLDVPLMIVALLVFGGQFGARTVAAALFTPGYVNLLTRAVYPNEGGRRGRFDPALLLNGQLNLSDDLLLTAIMGAVIIGVGQGHRGCASRPLRAVRTSWPCCCRSSPASSSPTGILLADGGRGAGRSVGDRLRSGYRRGG